MSAITPTSSGKILWEEYARTRSQSVRNRLVELYADVVHFAAARLAERLPQEVDVNDLIQWGMMGLMTAVEAFDPTRRVMFQTFASLRVRGERLEHHAA